MTQTSGLTVRQHEREGLEVPVEFVVSAAHAGQLRFSTSSAAIGPGTIRGQAIDISSGGLGFQCRQFVPRMCEGTVRVFAPSSLLSTKNSSGGSELPDFSTLELMFEQPVKVRRVTLVGREPSFSLGLAFLEPGQALDQQIDALFDRIGLGPGTATAGAVGAAGGKTRA